MKGVVADLAPRASVVRGQLDVAVDLLVVTGDRTLLQQVFFNLLGNALAYRRAEVAPVISVTATSANGRVRIDVRDNGLGIAPEHFEIFSMSSNACTATTRFPAPASGSRS